MEKIIVAVGDIHGCLEEFDELLKKIQYNPATMDMVLLGDLVDRGPDSAGVVARARELKLKAIKGNHEDKAIRFAKHEKNRLENGVANPMKSMSASDAKALEKMTEQDWSYLKNLPLKIDLGLNWYAVHAGVEPGVRFEKQIPAQVMRVRYVNGSGRGVALNPDKSQPEGTVYWDEQWKGPESIIYGHCVHDLKKVRHTVHNGVSMLGIDTGCVFGGHLTAAFLHKDSFVPDIYSPEFVQVAAKQKYFSGYGDE